MSKVAVGYNNGTLTLLLNGRAYQVTESHPNRKAITALLNKDNAEGELLALVTGGEKAFEKKLNDTVFGKVLVQNGVVTYNGEAIHNVVATRILQFQEAGLPFEALAKFLEKLESNPSSKSREQLYDFLEHKDLPLHEDGDFLAYKAINADWTDQYTGKISNHVGAEVSMDRSKVDDDHNRHCSKGLHVGAMDYVVGYGHSDGRVVICKVNPRDAVSVPTDSSFQKLRVCRYVVWQEYTGQLTGLLYDNAHSRVDEDEYDDTSWLDNLNDDDDYDYRSEQDEYDDEDDDYYDEGDVQSTGKQENVSPTSLSDLLKAVAVYLSPFEKK